MKGARRTRNQRHETGFADLMSAPLQNPPIPGVITGIARTPQTPPPEPKPQPSTFDDEWESLRQISPRRRISPQKPIIRTNRSGTSSRAASSVASNERAPSFDLFAPPLSPRPQSAAASDKSQRPRSLHSTPKMTPLRTPDRTPEIAPRSSAAGSPAIPAFLSGWEGTDGWGDDPSLDESDLEVDDDAWGLSDTDSPAALEIDAAFSVPVAAIDAVPEVMTHRTGSSPSQERNSPAPEVVPHMHNLSKPQDRGENLTSFTPPITKDSKSDTQMHTVEGEQTPEPVNDLPLPAVLDSRRGEPDAPVSPQEDEPNAALEHETASLGFQSGISGSPAAPIIETFSSDPIGPSESRGVDTGGERTPFISDTASASVLERFVQTDISVGHGGSGDGEVPACSSLPETVDHAKELGDEVVHDSEDVVGAGINPPICISPEENSTIHEYSKGQEEPQIDETVLVAEARVEDKRFCGSSANDPNNSAERDDAIASWGSGQSPWYSRIASEGRGSASVGVPRETDRNLGETLSSAGHVDHDNLETSDPCVQLTQALQGGDGHPSGPAPDFETLTNAAAVGEAEQSDIMLDVAEMPLETSTPGQEQKEKENSAQVENKETSSPDNQQSSHTQIEQKMNPLPDNLRETRDNTGTALHVEQPAAETWDTDGWAFDDTEADVDDYGWGWGDDVPAQAIREKDPDMEDSLPQQEEHIAAKSSVERDVQEKGDTSTAVADPWGHPEDDGENATDDWGWGASAQVEGAAKEVGSDSQFVLPTCDSADPVSMKTSCESNATGGVTEYIEGEQRSSAVSLHSKGFTVGREEALPAAESTEGSAAVENLGLKRADEAHQRNSVHESSPQELVLVSDVEDTFGAPNREPVFPEHERTAEVSTSAIAPVGAEEGRGSDIRSTDAEVSSTIAGTDVPSTAVPSSVDETEWDAERVGGGWEGGQMAAISGGTGPDNRFSSTTERCEEKLEDNHSFVYDFEGRQVSPSPNIMPAVRDQPIVSVSSQERGISGEHRTQNCIETIAVQVPSAGDGYSEDAKAKGKEVRKDQIWESNSQNDPMVSAGEQWRPYAHSEVAFVENKHNLPLSPKVLPTQFAPNPEGGSGSRPHREGAAVHTLKHGMCTEQLENPGANSKYRSTGPEDDNAHMSNEKAFVTATSPPENHHRRREGLEEIGDPGWQFPGTGDMNANDMKYAPRCVPKSNDVTHVTQELNASDYWTERLDQPSRMEKNMSQNHEEVAPNAAGSELAYAPRNQPKQDNSGLGNLKNDGNFWEDLDAKTSKPYHFEETRCPSVSAELETTFGVSGSHPGSENEDNVWCEEVNLRTVIDKPTETELAATARQPGFETAPVLIGEKESDFVVKGTEGVPIPKVDLSAESPSSLCKNSEPNSVFEPLPDPAPKPHLSQKVAVDERRSSSFQIPGSTFTPYAPKTTPSVNQIVPQTHTEVGTARQPGLADSKFPDDKGQLDEVNDTFGGSATEAGYDPFAISEPVSYAPGDLGGFQTDFDWESAIPAQDFVEDTPGVAVYAKENNHEASPPAIESESLHNTEVKTSGKVDSELLNIQDRVQRERSEDTRPRQNAIQESTFPLPPGHAGEASGQVYAAKQMLYPEGANDFVQMENVPSSDIPAVPLSEQPLPKQVSPEPEAQTLPRPHEPSDDLKDEVLHQENVAVEYPATGTPSGIRSELSELGTLECPPVPVPLPPRAAEYQDYAPQTTVQAGSESSATQTQTEVQSEVNRPTHPYSEEGFHYGLHEGGMTNVPARRLTDNAPQSITTSQQFPENHGSPHPCQVPPSDFVVSQPIDANYATSDSYGTNSLFENRRQYGSSIVPLGRRPEAPKPADPFLLGDSKPDVPLPPPQTSERVHDQENGSTYPVLPLAPTPLDASRVEIPELDDANTLDTKYYDPTTYAYPYSIMDTEPSGEIGYRPPRPVISWGFGGTLVVVLPTSSSRENATSEAGENTNGFQKVRLFDMKAVCEDVVHDDLMAANEAVPPLPYPVRLRDLHPYADMCDVLAQSSAGLSGSAAEGRAALWRTLGLLCRQGTTDWRSNASSVVAGPTSVPLIGLRENSGSVTGQQSIDESPLRLLSGRNSEGDTQRCVAASEVERLAAQGQVPDAVRLARKAGLWPLAIILSSNLDRQLHMDVISEYAKINLNDGSTLQTLCFSMAGDYEAIAKKATSESGLNEWRKTVSMLLSNYRSAVRNNDASGPRFLKLIEHVGDALIADRKDVVSGHVCHIISGKISALDSEQVPLLGASRATPPGRPRSLGAPAAILQSLVYEATANSQTGETFPHLLPLRLVLAAEIAAVGRPEVALAHCESISGTVRGIFESGRSDIARQAFTPPFLASLEALESRLRGHLGMGSSGSKSGTLTALGRSLSSVFNRSVKDPTTSISREEVRSQPMTSQPYGAPAATSEMPRVQPHLDAWGATETYGASSETSKMPKAQPRLDAWGATQTYGNPPVTSEMPKAQPHIDAWGATQPYRAPPVTSEMREAQPHMDAWGNVGNREGDVALGYQMQNGTAGGSIVSTPNDGPQLDAGKRGNERFNSIVSKAIGFIAPAEGDLSPPPRPRTENAFFPQGQLTPLGLGQGTGNRVPGETIQSNHMRSASIGAVPTATLNQGYGMVSKSTMSADESQFAQFGTPLPNEQRHGRRSEGIEQEASRLTQSETTHRRSASDMTFESQTSERKPPRPPKKSETGTPGSRKSERPPSESPSERPPAAKTWRSRFSEKISERIRNAFGGPPRAHMGVDNKFSFDKERGVWMMDGAPVDDSSSAPPPPPDDSFPDGESNAPEERPVEYSTSNMTYSSPIPRSQSALDAHLEEPMYRSSAHHMPKVSSFNDAFENRSALDNVSEQSAGSAASAPTPHSDRGISAGMPPIPGNRYRAVHGRLSGRRAYVDTFNKGVPASSLSNLPTPNGLARPASLNMTGARSGGYKIFTPTPSAVPLESESSLGQNGGVPNSMSPSPAESRRMHEHESPSGGGSSSQRYSQSPRTPQRQDSQPSRPRMMA